MSESATLWILGTIITVLLLVIAGIARMMLAHAKDCRDFRVKLAADIATLQGDVSRVIRDIGDHESGLRGGMHDLRNRMTPLAIWAEREMEQREQR